MDELLMNKPATITDPSVSSYKQLQSENPNPQPDIIQISSYPSYDNSGGVLSALFQAAEQDVSTYEALAISGMTLTMLLTSIQCRLLILITVRMSHLNLKLHSYPLICDPLRLITLDLTEEFLLG